MYTIALSPQEVRTIRDALERFQSDEFASLEATTQNYPNDLHKIMRTGANIVAVSDILTKLPRVSAPKVDLTFSK